MRNSTTTTSCQRPSRSVCFWCTPTSLQPAHAAKRAAGVIVSHKSPDQLAVPFLTSRGLNGAHQFPAHSVPPVIAVNDK